MRGFDSYHSNSELCSEKKYLSYKNKRLTYKLIAYFFYRHKVQFIAPILFLEKYQRRFQMETKIKKYQDIIQKYIEKLEKELENHKDPLLLKLFEDTKKLIVKNPTIPKKYLDFYTNWLEDEYEYLMTNTADLENSIRILMSISEKIQILSNSEPKKDGITYVTLDESILDIDSWLPKEAIQQVVDAIKRYEEKENKGE